MQLTLTHQSGLHTSPPTNRVTHPCMDTVLTAFGFSRHVLPRHQNPYKMNPANYGPDGTHAIDTTLPFQVTTSFVADKGALVAMVSVLSQAGSGRSVTLIHNATTCGDQYLASLSGVLEQGMAVVMSSWGNDGLSMAWLDAPPCSSSERCDVASLYTVSNITFSA